MVTVNQRLKQVEASVSAWGVRHARYMDSASARSYAQALHYAMGCVETVDALGLFESESVRDQYRNQVEVWGSEALNCAQFVAQSR